MSICAAVKPIGSGSMTATASPATRPPNVSTANIETAWRLPKDTFVRAIMDRYGVHTKTEAVDLALRHLAGQPMSRDEALAMRGVHAIDEPPADVSPRGLA